VAEEAFCLKSAPGINPHQTWGTGIRGLMSGMATLPQGNQELLVVRYNVGLLVVMI